ncbi:MAG: hypothetical protein HY400_05195, partial [Elusimicrobia bacterium]|nr:hypothetical protein [Elusimicrobiota bacterium]
ILAVGYTSLKQWDNKSNPESESVISKPVIPAAPLRDVLRSKPVQKPKIREGTALKGMTKNEVRRLMGVAELEIPDPFSPGKEEWLYGFSGSNNLDAFGVQIVDGFSKTVIVFKDSRVQSIERNRYVNYTLFTDDGFLSNRPQ